MSPNKYKEMLNKEVIKHYQKAPVDLENELNREEEILVSKFKVEGRIEKYNIKRCFITLKDHKSDSQSNPTCRLIDSSKSHNINQWRSTEDCIKWFNNLNKNDKCSFIK